MKFAHALIHIKLFSCFLEFHIMCMNSKEFIYENKKLHIENEKHSNKSLLIKNLN